MAFTAKDVISRVTTILQDAGNVRWTPLELLNWLNDALTEIPLIAPAAVAETSVISLVAGTDQAMPADAASILRVVCNVTGTSAPYTRGRAITPIKRQILDQQLPEWHDTTKLPPAAVVLHFVEDPLMTGRFLVCPANTGTGKIEVVVAKRPAQITAPANPLDINSYTATVGLDDMYRNACVDFVMSKALLKDIGIAGGPQRAQAHYNAYLQALGLRPQTEAAFNPTSDDPSKAARPS